MDPEGIQRPLMISLLNYLSLLSSNNAIMVGAAGVVSWFISTILQCLSSWPSSWLFLLLDSFFSCENLLLGSCSIAVSDTMGLIKCAKKVSMIGLMMKMMTRHNHNHCQWIPMPSLEIQRKQACETFYYYICAKVIHNIGPEGGLWQGQIIKQSNGNDRRPIEVSGWVL